VKTGKNVSIRDKSPGPWAILTKLRAGEGVNGAYPHAKLHGCGFKNVGLTGAKIAIILIFWYFFC